MNLIFAQKKENNNSEYLTTNEDEKKIEEKDNKTLCQKCQKLEKELNQLVYLKYQIEQQFQEEKLKNNLLNKQKEEFNKQFQTVHSSNSNLKNALSIKTNEITQLENIIKDLQNKKPNVNYNENLIKAINDSSKSKQHFYENEINKIQIQLESSCKRNCELESKITKLLEENTKLKKTFDILKNTNIRLTSQITNEIDDKKNKLSNYNVLVEENQFYKQKLEEYEKKIKESQNIFEEKNEKLENLTEKLKNTSKLKENTTITLKELQIQFSMLQEENNFLKEKIKNNEENFLKINHHLNYKTQTLNINENDNKILYKENNELKVQIENLQKYIQHLEKIPKKDFETENSLRENYIHLEKENKSQLLQIQKLSNENEFLKRFYNNTNPIKAHPQPMLVLKQLDQNAESEYKTLIDSIYKEKIVIENKLNETQNTLNSTRIMVSQLTKELTRKEAECTQLTTKNYVLEQQLCEANRDNLKHRNKNTSIEEENIKLSALNNQLTDEISSKMKTLQYQNISHSTMQKVNNNKEEIILELNNKIFKLEKIAQDKEISINELMDKIDEKNKIIEKLSKDKEKLLSIIHKKK